ncbi:MAG: LysR family transcriptional regulator [Arenicellales bacterium]|nr:LysR family transcriptional regulator [Arenicellales bacterium]
MHVTIRQLKVFEAVATNLSYTKAAEALHLTQPAVSMQIKQLESAVGLPLFEVLGKKVFLTEAGQLFLKHTRTLLDQLELAEEEINSIKGIDSGHLKITIASTVNYFAARLLAKFCRQHENVRVSLEVTNRKTLLERLEANQPDIALMGQPPEGLEVDAEPFMSNPLVVIAAPSNPLLQSKKPMSAKQFAEQAIILREPGSGTRDAVERFFRERGVNPTSRTEMASNEAIKQAVEAGLGVAVVSIHTVELETAVGRLAQLNVQGFPIKRKWYVAHRTGKHLSTTAQAFRDFVLSEGKAYEENQLKRNR